MMNSSKIASEVRFNHLSISQIAEKYDIPKAEVVRLIFNFFATFPNSSHTPSIKYRFKAVLTEEFRTSNSSALDFAEEYGIHITAFHNLMREVIDDYHIVKSNGDAITLFKKTFDGVAVISKNVPKRIVKQLAESYANDKYITQYSLSSIYGIRRSTVSSLLKRAIAENIVDDITAEKIIVLIRSYNKSVDGYSEAFDKRAKLKSEQA